MILVLAVCKGKVKPFLCLIKHRAINPLKVELNPICHLLALLGAHHILHVSRIRVKAYGEVEVELRAYLPLVPHEQGAK